MNMIITADYGALEAFTISQGEKTKAVHLEEEILVEEDRGPYKEKVTDQATCFRHWGATAEKTTIELEKKRRAVQELTKAIETLLQKHQPFHWYFAAPEEINRALMEGLNEKFKKTLRHNLKKDLINIPPEELLGHFE